jgi:hypothetical protein
LLEAHTRAQASRRSVFGPKVLAGIDNGRLPDTIRDRSIMLRLHWGGVENDHLVRRRFARRNARHAHITTTMRYVHYRPGPMKRAGSPARSRGRRADLGTRSAHES